MDVLVLITGLPCSGRRALAQALASRLPAGEGAPHRWTLVVTDLPREAERRKLAHDHDAVLTVHVCTAPSACIDRDDSEVWARALRGELRGFVGVDVPYEPPPAPDLALDLDQEDAAEAAERVRAALARRGLA